MMYNPTNLDELEAHLRFRGADGWVDSVNKAAKHRGEVMLFFERLEGPPSVLRASLVYAYYRHVKVVQPPRI